MEKFCSTGQATDDNIIRRMHFACWITKATDTHTHTHSEYVILVAFPRNSGSTKESQRCFYTFVASFVIL